jgi:anti-sigma B factor antagonist
MNIRTIESATVVEIPDRFDSNIASEVEKELNGLVSHGQVSILCDFSRTSYISSAGLRVLLATFKKTKSWGRFGVFSLAPYVRGLDISVLEEYPIYPIQRRRKDRAPPRRRTGKKCSYANYLPYSRQAGQNISSVFPALAGTVPVHCRKYGKVTPVLAKHERGRPSWPTCTPGQGNAWCCFGTSGPGVTT